MDKLFTFPFFSHTTNTLLQFSCYCKVSVSLDIKFLFVIVCVSDGRMRQIGSSLTEGHVTSDEQPPNMSLTHPSHTPGSYTGNTPHPR